MAFEIKIKDWIQDEDGTYGVAVPADEKPMVQVFQYELPGKISSILISPHKITYAILIKAVFITVLEPFEGYVVIR